MIKSVRNRKSKDVEVNITNMIDVVFVLLIFFVLTTTFAKETGVDITKPSAGSAKQLAKEPLLIGITREGALYVNERQVDLAVLSSILKREGASDPDKSVVLVSDKNTPMGVIVSVLDECNQAGLTKVSVSTVSEM
jgi:biopolymer transport protein ExbD